MARAREGEYIAGVYEVRVLLGEGTLGYAYQVQEKNTKHLAVIKYLPEGIARDRARAVQFVQFYRDRRKLKHKGIISILDIQVEEGIPFVVFPFLEGVSLATLVSAKFQADQKFSWEEGSEILEGIARILAHAHPFVHGNLKPRNIFLQMEGITLSDDGFLSFLPPEEFVKAQNRLPLAAGFMAPELFTDPRPAVTLDLYSFGALCYFIFTGKEPGHPLEPLPALRPDLPSSLSPFLTRLLADDPAGRFSSFAELLFEWGKAFSRPDLVDEAGALLEKTKVAQAPPASLKAAPPPPPPVEPRKAPSLFDEESLEISQYQPSPPPSPKTEPASQVRVSRRFSLLPLLGGIILLLLAGGGSYLFLSSRSSLKAPSPAPLPTGDVQLSQTVRDTLLHLDDLRKQLEKNYGELTTFAEAVSLTLKAKEYFLKKDQISEALRMAQNAEKLFLKLSTLSPPQKTEPSPPEKKTEETEAKISGTQPRFLASEESQRSAKPSCPKDMILVSGGTYRVGSKREDPLRDPLLDQEERKVSLPDFCVDIYEFPNRPGAIPTSGVNFTEAKKLCQEAGKRLCTEEEWEAACRGKVALTFPYGNNWDPDSCNTETREGKDRSLEKSGSKKGCRSPVGALDMSGNLMEWTSTSFEKDPNRFLVKGGSYLRPNYAARCSYRYPAPKDLRDPEFGLRCCADVK